MSKVRVLVVDDSSVIRSIICKILEAEPDVEIVGSAPNGEIAIGIYKRTKPDIMFMDIEMPVMDGITALTQIMELDRQAKVVMCSTLTVDNAEITMRAMRIGAIDYISKPTSHSEINGSDDFKARLLRLAKGITGTGVSAQVPTTTSKPSTVAGVPVSTKPLSLRPEPLVHWKPKIVAIGSSTGGPQALFEVMKALKGIKVPVVITQHMPATFTRLLAQHISTQAGFECVEGADGMTLENGKAILAPGGKHMGFAKNAAGQVVVKLNDGPPENYCKPAVDPMYRSLVDHFDNKILSVILTGMGADGQKGAQMLVDKGGFCVAQDQATSVVWGMPGAVATAGLCSAVLPLNKIAPWVLSHAQ